MAVFTTARLAGIAGIKRQSVLIGHTYAESDVAGIIRHARGLSSTQIIEWAELSRRGSEWDNLNGIIVAFDRDEKCTFAKRSHAQVVCLQPAYKDTCENLQRSAARLVH